MAANGPAANGMAANGMAPAWADPNADAIDLAHQIIVISVACGCAGCSKRGMVVPSGRTCGDAVCGRRFCRDAAKCSILQ
jgi:hypothetical protein